MEVYDFSCIEDHLDACNSCDKKLFIHIQDRSLSCSAPNYLLNERACEDGIELQLVNLGDAWVHRGWVAKQWVSAVRKRYRSLLSRLAERFDVRISGISLPETFITAYMEGFDHKKYIDVSIENIMHAKKVFKKSYVVQCVNFWPGELGNSCMEQLFISANKSTILDEQTQTNSSYHFFSEYKFEINPIAMAFKEDTLEHKNEKTGRSFTKKGLKDLAVDNLGAAIIFWSPEIWYEK